MKLTAHEWWAVVHGMGLGAVFLLAFAGGLVELWTLRREWLTPPEVSHALRRLKTGVWAMAAAAWLTVITGTYIVYPWYRAKSPDSPRSKLLGNPDLAAWHSFAMEWKEHIAWASPILATVVAFVVTYYAAELAARNDLRRAAIVLFVLAFAAAAIGGVFGAFINKVAPIL